MAAEAVFSGSSNGQNVAVQGRIAASTDLTNTDILDIKSSASTAQVAGGSTLTFAQIRLNSTAKKASGSVTVYFASADY